MSPRHLLAASALAATAALAACGDDTSAPAGSGSVSFTSWGEEYIEVGIPAADFADGWSARYTRFLVLVGNVRVADADGEVGGERPGFVLVDHVAPGVKPIATLDGLEARAWTHVSYEISPASARHPSSRSTSDHWSRISSRDGGLRPAIERIDFSKRCQVIACATRLPTSGVASSRWTGRGRCVSGKRPPFRKLTLRTRARPS